MTAAPAVEVRHRGLITLAIMLATIMQVLDTTIANVALPSMALQTLVENAIKHGLEPKPGGGTIWLLAREADGQVNVTVADDGQGFGGGSSGTGIGLKNLRERLRLTRGTEAGFALVSNFPSGMAATLTLPRRAAATASVEPPHAA